MYHAMACVIVPKLSYLGEHSEVSKARSLHSCWTRMLYHDRLETIDTMRTMCSRKIFTKKCRQQQIFDSDLKGAWHYNHVTFTPIAKNFMFCCRLIYMLSILCVRLKIKVKVGIPESFKVGWYLPPKKLGRVTLSFIPCLFSLLVTVSGDLIVNNIRNLRRNLSVLFKTRQTSKRIW